MIGLDTNVVLQYLIGNDAGQSQSAKFVIDEICSPEAPGFLHSVVLAELWWVMIRTLKIPAPDAIAKMETLLSNPHLAVRNIEAALLALHLCGKSKADFADCLIAFENRDDRIFETFSFDEGALNAGVMVRLPEKRPFNPI